MSLKTPPTTRADAVTAARRVIDTEIAGLSMLRDNVDATFSHAVDRLLALKGRAILAGVGKSGHVARKIAATMASTGTPAQYVHPTEASHGDLGMITDADVVIALSKSGETRELGDLLAYAKRFSIPLIAMTAQGDSQLGRAADIALVIPDAAEACAETRAPTTSTTLMMALGDALAVALLEAKGFSAEAFRAYHPGGALGAALATLADIMHGGDAVPLIAPDAPMSEALLEMSAKGFGCVGVVANGKLSGVITDGDLRRHMGSALLERRAGDVMTAAPRMAPPNMLAAEALRMMTAVEPRVTVLFVVDEAGAPVGVVHVHDCLRVGVA